MPKVGVRKALHQIQGIESPGVGQWAKPQDDLECSILSYPEEAKKPPCLPLYWHTMSEKNSSSLGTYKKGKIGSIRLHKFRQAETANEQANFLACAGIYTEKIDQSFFPENLSIQT